MNTPEDFLKGRNIKDRTIRVLTFNDKKGTLCLYESGDTTSARCIHCGREKWEHKRA